MAAESISRFFEKLGFSLRNERTSWGAVDGDTVLLRTWLDQYDARSGRVIVFGWHGGRGGTTSTGWNERKAQLRMLWRGDCPAYTVIVQPDDKERNGVRKIRDFRSDVVFPIATLMEEGGTVYAQVSKAAVPIERLAEHRKVHRVTPNGTPLPDILVDTQPPEPSEPADRLAYRAVAVRDYLIDAASRRTTVTYGELFSAFDLNRMTIPKVLAAVGHQCRANGEPILTALVVLKSTGQCSTGLAREFGVDEDEERQRIFEHWSQGAAGSRKRNGLDWSELELHATVQAYREMFGQHRAGVPFVKARYYEALARRFDRDAGAYERRMQNISAVLDMRGLPWLPGLKPQINIGTHVAAMLLECLQALIAELTPSVELPEEIPDADTIVEGAKRRITVNAYERDPSAKPLCLKRWSTSCVVCGFDFGAVYGELGAGFIHVHHLRPLSTIGEAYELDPVEDLRPVCPNCHAMLHRKKDVLAIDELRTIIDKQASKRAISGQGEQ